MLTANALGRVRVRARERADVEARTKSTFLIAWFLPLVLVIWAVTPEIRRVIDWQLGFSKLPIISVIPLLALAVLIFPVVRSGLKNATAALRVVMILWISGFGYALAISFISRNYIGGVYDLVQFILPMLFALTLLTDGERFERNYARLANVLLVLATILSAYGIFQYVSPPPWDIAWILNADLASLGVPEPFGFHVFSMLNAPGPFADFLTLVLLVNLPRIRLRSPFVVAGVCFIASALALTFIRSAWLALAIGGMVYVVLSPRRFQLVVPVAIGAALVVTLALNASTILGNPTVTANLVERISSLSDVQNDESANDRQRETNLAIHDAIDEPMGQGLGTVGTSTKLGRAGDTTTLDNGYLSRILEMGTVGGIAYIAALIAAFGFTMHRYQRSLARHDKTGTALLATAAAVQVALLGLDLSSDHHSGFAGIFFWFSVVAALRAIPKASSAAESQAVSA